MSSSPPPVVTLAAGTCTGAGTSVALVVACRTLSEQVASGRISSAEVRIPRGAHAARNAAVGLSVVERSRGAALLEELIGMGKCDMYIGFADRLPLFGRRVGSRIMVVQNPHLYQASDAPSLGGLGRKVLTWWAERSVAAADLIICATEASRDSVLAAVPAIDDALMEVRPIRPETPIARQGVSPEIRRILLLGDLYAYKRFDVALDGIVTWAKAAGTGGAVEVVHCGSVQDQEAAASFERAVDRAADAGLSVLVRGSVPHEVAMGELSSADLLVSASEVETQGLTILEALAVGVPVVARSIGPVTNVAGDAFQPFDLSGGASELAAAIGEIAPLDVRQRLIERGFVKADFAVGWDLLPVGLSSGT